MNIDKKKWTTPLDNISKKLNGKIVETFILIDYKKLTKSPEAIIELFSSFTFDGTIWKEKWPIGDIWLIDGDINSVDPSVLICSNHGVKNYYKFDKLGPWQEKMSISWESILDILTISQLKLIKTSLTFYFDRKNSSNKIDSKKSYSSRLIEHVISLCTTLVDKKKTQIYRRHRIIEILTLVGTLLAAIAAFITAIVSIK